MMRFREGDFVFNYRISGLTVHNGKVLIHKIEDEPDKKYYWTLPGGHPEFMEDSHAALKREYKEETGFDVTIGRMVWFVENFFKYEDTDQHEMLLVYLVDFDSGSECLDQEEFYGQEGDKKIIFRWIDPKDAESIGVYPQFLRKMLNNIPDTTERVVQIG